MNSSSNRFVSSVLSVVATAGLVAMASPARATSLDTDAPRQVLVHAGDLDLATASGRTALERRITTAARAVCDTQLPGLARIDLQCNRETIAQARRDSGLDQTAANG